MKLKKIIPRYAVFPIAAALVLNYMAYFVTRLFTTDMVHHTMNIFLDDWIPLCKPFIVVYILAYVQWIVGYISIAREGKNFCYSFFTGEMIAKFICMLFFVIYPTMMVRPEIVGDGIFDQLTRLIYASDQPDNLFPSIHCLESWFCMRAAFKQHKVSYGYRVGMLIMSILVFLSVVFVKQHVVLDFFGAVVVAEFGLWVSGKIDWRKYDK